MWTSDELEDSAFRIESGIDNIKYSTTHLNLNYILAMLIEN